MTALDWGSGARIAFPALELPAYLVLWRAEQRKMNNSRWTDA